MDIDPKDIVVSTYSPSVRSGWSIGNDNGVTITHKPTGLSASCDEERSQFRNKAIAFELLTKLVREYVPPKMDTIEDVTKLLLSHEKEVYIRAAQVLMKHTVLSDMKSLELDHVATVGPKGQLPAFVMVRDGVDLWDYAGKAMYCRKND